VKKLLFILQSAPIINLRGKEGLDALLMGSAFTECGLLLVGDGCFQLMRHQQTEQLNFKNHSATFGVLADYGIEKIYASAVDMEARNLKAGDLLIPVELCSDDDISQMLDNHDVTLSF